MQNYCYDIVTNKDRMSNILQQRNSTLLKKVNGISEYAQDTHITAPNYSKDYQAAYKTNTSIFKKSQGTLS